MTTVVGIFDKSEQVEEAASHLADADLDAVVLNETVLAQEPGSVDPARPAMVRGAAADVVAGREEPTLVPKRDAQSLIRAFRERLTEDYDLAEDVTDGYVTTFSHGGTFVIAQVDEDKAEQAMQLLRDAGATRVNKHD